MNDIISTRTIYILLIITGLIVLDSCKPAQKPVDTKDLSYLYNPTKNQINPRFKILNQSDELSVLSVKFFENDIYFSQANPEGIPKAAIMIAVKLYNISSGNILADTAVYNLSIAKEKGRTEYVYNIPLNTEQGFEYMTEIRIMDRIRLKVVQTFVPFNTLSKNNRYNFRVLGHFSKNELFTPTFRINEYINLVYSRGFVDSLYISYYKPFREIPDPPSMILPEKTLDYLPERTIAIQYSDTLPMMLPREGIYHCTISRDSREGFTLFNMGESFPDMTSPEVMIEPLAYIANKEEVDALRSDIKPKMALDDFWIKCGGNIEKARELIRIYYTRVYYANAYFTSYKEGWRSERGMIYIIYGPPDKVYKTTEGENWGYLKPVLQSQWGGRYTVREEYLFFNFKRKENPFSDNDFYLSRNETLVTYWDKAVMS